MPAVASCALLGTVVAAGLAAQSLGGGDDDSGGASAASATLAPQTTALTTTTAIVTTTSSTTTTTAPIVKTDLSETLGPGEYGDEVTALQERLKQLGFDPGPIDGDFGNLTRMAVWAFEKLVMQTPRAEATGEVTNEMWQRMQDPLQVVPRRPDAASVNHTEIYLPEQVVIFFREDKAALITHMSSGTGDEWCEEVTISPGERGNETGLLPLKRGECGVSKTPGGVFTFDRQRTGAWDSALGTMWNPMYFNFGIAIHGAMNVPLEPASHGCIRIPMTLGEYFQSLAAKGDQVFVFDGIEEPEAYDEDEKMMIFNRLDPNYTTTTSTTLPPPPGETAVPPADGAPAAPPAEQTNPPPAEEPPAPPPAPPADDGGNDGGGDDGGDQGGGSASGGDGSGDGGGGGGGLAPPSVTQPVTAAPTQATAPGTEPAAESASSADSATASS